MRPRQHRPAKSPRGGHQAVWLYGRHPVLAALANPERRVERLLATKDVAERHAKEFAGRNPQVLSREELAQRLPAGAVHQGLAALAAPLEEPMLEDLLARCGDDALILALDQVTDPHNVGAILRSAAAFDALGIVTQDRHAPPESGTVARSASGALETVPWIRVVNLARALEEIAEAGFWRIGLTGHANQTLAQAMGTQRICIVLGAEGEGMRQNTEAHCDELAKLPISPKVESLNVSNAAAIALYAVAAR